jgi:hypothetical protein
MFRIRRSAITLVPVAVVTLLILGGCSPRPPGKASEQVPKGRDLPVQVLSSGTQCGDPKPGVRLFTPAEWALWNARPSGVWQEVPIDVPAVETEEGTIVLVSMGRQPTAGYALGVADFVSDDGAGEITVTLVRSQPAPDAIVAQVLTLPCVAIQVDGEQFAAARLDSPTTVILRR